METINLIRLILGLFFIGLGVLVFILEIIGVFKFKYVLNRMHFAGTGDTLGLASVILGSVILNGMNFGSVKFILVLILFWFSSPVASHLVGRMVLEINDDTSEHVKICDEEESLALFEGEEK